MTTQGNGRAAITRTEKLQLEGLQALAKRHATQITACMAAMEEIVGPETDHLTDLIWSEVTVGAVLDRMEVDVVPDTAAEAAPAQQPAELKDRMPATEVIQ